MSTPWNISEDFWGSKNGVCILVSQCALLPASLSFQVFGCYLFSPACFAHNGQHFISLSPAMKSFHKPLKFNNLFLQFWVNTVDYRKEKKNSLKLNNGSPWPKNLLILPSHGKLLLCYICLNLLTLSPDPFPLLLICLIPKQNASDLLWIEV